MIFESWPWKEELDRLAASLRHGATAADYTAAEVPFDMEKSLFYSAFVIRKLIEGSKITDRIANIKIGVLVFEAAEQRQDRIRTTSADFEIGRDFNDQPTHEIQYKLTNLTSEIIHSFPLIWSCSQSGKLDGFFVSSFRNEDRRLLRVPLRDYCEKIDIVANDDVVFSVIKKDLETGIIERKKE